MRAIHYWLASSIQFVVIHEHIYLKVISYLKLNLLNEEYLDMLCQKVSSHL
jgi:hypothetical protein